MRIEEEKRRTETVRSSRHRCSQLSERKHGPNRHHNDLIPLSEAEKDSCDHDQADHESDHPYTCMDMRSICAWKSMAKGQTKCDGDDEAVCNNQSAALEVHIYMDGFL